MPSYYWVGGGDLEGSSTDFDTPGNWLGGVVPTAGADIVFAAAVYVPPPVRVGAGHWTHPGNCDNAHGDPDGPYASVHLTDVLDDPDHGKYAGTVTLKPEEDEDYTFTTGILEMDGAETSAISQPVDHTDIVVTNSFTWHTGTINSSNHLSTLYLAGATGTIAPTGAGTVYLGSTLSLVSAAIHTFRSSASYLRCTINGGRSTWTS